MNSTVTKTLLSVCATLLLSQSINALNTDVSNFFIEWRNHNGLPTMVEVEEKLESCKSEYQEIEMYKTATFGNMMLIDGVIMLTQRENFAYHEMIAHVPMVLHAEPKRVLIVGGGDGGTLTEILKHDSVTEVVLCEIDAKVIELSKKYFPEFSAAFEDSRVTIAIQDAAKYITTKEDYFDVICVDSTDPFGPGEVLFQKEFYTQIKNALTHDGIAVTQSESMYLYTDLIKALYKQNSELFPYASYYFTLVPTYPSGTIGFSLCSKKEINPEEANFSKVAALKNLRYYNKAMHKASFQLPQFLHDELHSN